MTLSPAGEAFERILKQTDLKSLRCSCEANFWLQGHALTGRQTLRLRLWIKLGDLLSEIQIGFGKFWEASASALPKVHSLSHLSQSPRTSSWPQDALSRMIFLRRNHMICHQLSCPLQTLWNLMCSMKPFFGFQSDSCSIGHTWLMFQPSSQCLFDPPLLCH